MADAATRKATHPTVFGILLARSIDDPAGRLTLDQRSAMMTEIKTKLPSTRARSLQIATLVAELRRAADLLAASIKQEELMARVSDPMDCHYPMTARSLEKRREKISATIAALEVELREAA